MAVVLISESDKRYELKLPSRVDEVGMIRELIEGATFPWKQGWALTTTGE